MSPTTHRFTPQQILDALVEGNERWAKGVSQHPHFDEERRRQMVEGQAPVAAILSCSDSRVPAEIVFDRGLGDLFVIRTAGETLDLAVLGSIEYAVESLGVSLLVVMGHESCGAVKTTAGALDGDPIPHGFQRALVEKVAPSVLLSKADGHTEVADFERRHILETMSQIIARYPELQHHLAEGSVAVVGARYRLSDQRVEILRGDGVEIPT